MTTKNVAKMKDVKQHSDGAVKALVTKDNILKLKYFIEEQKLQL